jgi:hypothetical protein
MYAIGENDMIGYNILELVITELVINGFNSKQTYVNRS